MNDNGLRIDAVRVSELERLARDAERCGSEHGAIPITPHRARAHAANPCADKDDVVLLVAYQDGRCVGYVGVMPGYLWVGGRLEKMYWGSGYYVSPDQRRSGVAMQLMSGLLERNYDLAAAAPSRMGGEICRGLGFIEVGPLEYLSFKRTRPPTSQSRTSRVASRIGGVLRRVARRLRPSERPGYVDSADIDLEIGPWRFRPIPAVTPELLPTSGCTDAAFHRGPEIINWMLSFPWIAESRNTRPAGYYFSDVRDVFRHILLGAYRPDDTCRGFVALSLSAQNGAATLKVLDNALPPDDRDACLAQLALACAERFGVKRVELSRQYRVAEQVFGASWTLERKQRLYFCRPYGADGPLAQVLDRLELHYCDGENPFI